MELNASFAGTPAGARAARYFVRDALNAPDHEFRATVLLLTGEVATNAMLHGGGNFEVTLELIDDGGVRISVSDDSTEAPQLRTMADTADATTGRGLRLVDALASDWGVDHHRHGKVVWFEARPGQPSPESSCDARRRPAD